MTGASISTAEQAAAARYGRDYARAGDLHRPADKRLEVIQSLSNARRVLTPPQVALMNATAGRGQTLAEMATATGMAVGLLEAAFLSCCRKLAEHYEAAAE